MSILKKANHSMFKIICAKNDNKKKEKKEKLNG